MNRSKTVSTVQPGEVAPELAERAFGRIQDYLSKHPVDPTLIEVVMEHGEPALVLPRETVVLLAQILAQLAEGRGVAVLPSEAELSTQQAADLLGVSRPFLVNLIDDHQIPHRKVGRHRRIALSDLLNYQRTDDAKRRHIADEIGNIGQELGL